VTARAQREGREAFSHDGGCEPVIAVQVAEYCVGILAVDFDEPLEGNRVSVAAGRLHTADCRTV
jgi:hypothetical protein